jgi:5-methylcytosine-specific restriction endonuclease McrA
MALYGKTVRGLCHCGKQVRARGRNSIGLQIFDTKCWSCRCEYRKYKKDSCGHCGFVALHPVQLDVDHIDGDRTNNNEDNLQTLCANCHRLKTQLSGDHLRGRDA